jgi:hypothetical protein
MPEPQKIRAFAEDGPLAGDLNLTVDNHDAEGRWPSPVVWRTGPGPDERHVYVLGHISLTPTGVPTYRHERTLRADEEPPPEGRTKPPN